MGIMIENLKKFGTSEVMILKLPGIPRGLVTKGWTVFFWKSPFIKQSAKIKNGEFGQGTFSHSTS